MGLNSALAVSSSAIEVFTTAIEVHGNNIANANTPGYVRGELELLEGPSYRRGHLILGTGVLAGGIKQQVDTFLESRVNDAATDAANADAINGVYKQLEAELRELGDSDLSTSLNNFLSAINDVLNEPESIPIREIAVQQAEQLARDVSNLRARVDEIRRQQSTTVDSLVGEANQLIQQIAELNPEIAKLEAAGALESDAGSLRSDRRRALARLAEIFPVTTHENADGSVNVYSNENYLVLGTNVQQLQTTNTIDRGVAVQTVTLSDTNANITTIGGELGGIGYARDNVLGGFVDDLDAFARNIIFEFNKLHSEGQGLDGFTSLTSQNALVSTTADLDDATATGLPFTPTHGGFQVRVTNSTTGLTETVDVTVDLDGIGADDGLDDLRGKLDAIANLNATITADGRLQLATTSGYEVSFADDTSNVLAALGLNTFFTGRDSGDIAVNTVVANDPGKLAAALGGGPSDGRNALRLAEFHETALADLGNVSIDDHYRNTVTRVAQESASQDTILAGRGAYLESLGAQQAQFSGVSIDEEAVKILELQRAFQASARVISTVDELYTTLLNM